MSAGTVYAGEPVSIVRGTPVEMSNDGVNWHSDKFRFSEGSRYGFRYAGKKRMYRFMRIDKSSEIVRSVYKKVMP